jgi:CRP/FNR family cyclic AMP-dependent transcriptional regulator
MTDEPTPSEAAAAAATTGRTTRPLDESPLLAGRAVELLRVLRASPPLNADEAREIVRLMRLVAFNTGATLFREGESSAYLLLVLEGEVEIDTGDRPAGESVEISVLGPGSVIGEMALIDGSPRSANCTALSPVRAAGLSRRALELLLERQPAAAAKFTLGLAQIVAERLRALSQQIQLYGRLCAEQQIELQSLRRKN